MNAEKNFTRHRGNRKRLHRSLLFLSLINLIVFSTPINALACGSCMFAVFDRILPPIHLWSFFPIIWFLAPSIAVMIRRGKVVNIPSFITAAAFVLGSLPCSSKIEAALRVLSGIDLPEGTPAVLWWRNWKGI